MTTTLTVWGHACVALDRAGRRLVVDPGSFSDRSVLATADAVLVTHGHGDHVVARDVLTALESRSHLEVWAPDAVADALVADGLPTDRIHRVRGGDRFEAAGFGVEALGEWHAVIHPDIPRVHNVAYLVDGVLHPGDSFTCPAPGRAVDVLLAPVSGPWLKVAEVIDLVRAVAPRVVVPIHDALLSPAGLTLVDRLVGAHGGAPVYRRLGAGERFDIG